MARLLRCPCQLRLPPAAGFQLRDAGVGAGAKHGETPFGGHEVSKTAAQHLRIAALRRQKSRIFLSDIPCKKGAGHWFAFRWYRGPDTTPAAGTDRSPRSS